MYITYSLLIARQRLIHIEVNRLFILPHGKLPRRTRIASRPIPIPTQKLGTPNQLEARPSPGRQPHSQNLLATVDISPLRSPPSAGIAHSEASTMDRCEARDRAERSVPVGAARRHNHPAKHCPQHGWQPHLRDSNGPPSPE